MYRSLLLPMVHPKRLMRYNSTVKNLSDFFAEIGSAESLTTTTVDEKSESASTEVLDDLSTFGSVLKKESSVLALANDTTLKNLIQDIYSESPTPRGKPDSSVEEKQMFNSIFETILSNNGARRDVTSNFMSGELKRDESIDLSLFSRARLEKWDSAVPDDYQKSQVLKLRIINLLKPSFEHIDRIESCKQLLTYINTEIFERFDRELKGGVVHEEKSTEQILKELEDLNPTKPLLNKLTLPILMEYFIKTLVRNFDSPNEAISLFHSLKSSPPIYLRACNVDLYNLLLQITWDADKNINEVDSIIKDMLLNGFPGNLKTIKILSTIKLEVMRNLSTNDKDLFINKFRKYRYHYFLDIDRRMKLLTRNI